MGGRVGTLILLLAAYLLSITPFKIPTISSTTMLASSFYLAGYSFNKQLISKRSSLSIGLFCLGLLFVISLFFQGSMSVTSTDIFIYFIVALIGVMGVLNIAIKGKVQKILDYMGSKTLYLLTFHFLAFKLVSLIKIWCYGLPITELSSFPIIREQNTYFWILYSIVGVVLPIAIWEVVKHIQNEILNNKTL